MKTRLDLFGLMAAAIEWSGCAGIIVQHHERLRIEAPQIDVQGNVRCDRSLPAFTREDVERVWGPPTRLERDGAEEERWTYVSSDLRWTGVELIVFVPVPLIVPVGHESVTLMMKDGLVVDAEVMKQDESHAVFGLMAGPCGLSSRLCDLGRDSQSRKPGERWVHPTWLEGGKKN